MSDRCLISLLKTLLTGAANPRPELSKKRKGKQQECSDDEKDESSSQHSRSDFERFSFADPFLLSLEVSGDPLKKTPSQHKVRTSLKERTLDSMFPVSNPAQISNISIKGSLNVPAPQNSSSQEIKESECFLTSVKNLRQNLLKGKHRRKFVLLLTLSSDYLRVHRAQ